MTAYVELQCNGWLRGDWQPIVPCSARYGVQEPTSLHQTRGRASEDGWSSEVVQDATTRQPMWVDLCETCTRDRRPPLRLTMNAGGVLAKTTKQGGEGSTWRGVPSPPRGVPDAGA